MPEIRPTTILSRRHALQLMYKAGKTRAIGVSNFCDACLDCIAKGPAVGGAVVVPAVNQLQFHAGMPGSDPHGLFKRVHAARTCALLAACARHAHVRTVHLRVRMLMLRH